ncbi:MAG: hypothetical protein JOZ42_04535 [Acetobacteraceae bacterium]|nr:hypothetical protein [Acetobacteraceae bacterium]
MTQTTWDPSTNRGEILSNGNRTATDPGNSGVVDVEGTTPVGSGQKVFVEYDVSGGGTGTGLAVGFATQPFDGVTDANDPAPNGLPLGNHLTNPYPSYATSVTAGYDGGIGIGGYFVFEPHRGINQWQDGSYVDLALDTVNNRFWVYSSSTGEWNNSSSADPATNTGGIDASAVAGQTLFPLVTGWTKGGGTATINGGSAGFRGDVPSGFTALDDLGSGSGGGGSSGGGGGGSGGGSGSGNGSPSTVYLGSGSDTLSLQIAEDAWNGDAQFTISIDGHQIGGTQTATASHAAGQSQTFNVSDDLGSGNHTATVNFVNDAWGGTASADRNLYVEGATIDGTSVPSSNFTEYQGGPQSFSFATGSSGGTGGSPPGSVTIGQGSDTLALQVSEDAWMGNAQFTVSVDGRQIGGTQTAAADHGSGQTQTFDVLGSFGAGHHTVSVDFLNDAWGGTAQTDRNLYVTSASIDGQSIPGASLTEYAGGPQSFAFSLNS